MPPPLPVDQGFIRLAVVYVPAHFAMPAATARQVLSRTRLADLVTIDPDEMTPVATPLPLLYRPDEGEFGSFETHVSRANTQWRHTAHPALVLVRAGDSYVTPDWYPTYRGGGSAVPTWDYEVVHAYGHLVAHDDPAWIEQHVRDLSAHFDPDYDLDRSQRRVVDGLIRGLMGLSIEITSVTGKSKLSQNKPSIDVQGVADGLEADGRADLAGRVREVALPHALAKEATVERARTQRRG